MHRLFTQSRFAQSRTGIRRPRSGKVMNQPFEVGGLCSALRSPPDHQRLAAGRYGEEMVTDIVNADLGRTRCRAGRHLHHHGAKPGACRMGRRKWKKFDHDLCERMVTTWINDEVIWIRPRHRTGSSCQSRLAQPASLEKVNYYLEPALFTFKMFFCEIRRGKPTMLSPRRVAVGPGLTQLALARVPQSRRASS